MSSRPQFNPYPTIVDGDMSADITSEVTIIQKLTGISFSYVWAGTAPEGRIVVEVSDDYSQNADGTVRNPGSWNECPLSAVTLITGDTGTGFIDMAGCMAYAIRTRYIFDSGVGVLQSIITAKVF